MAFFPHVNPGDQFKPSTLLANNLRDMVNSFYTTGELPPSRGNSGSYRLPCWNNNDYAIPVGASLEIDINAAWAGDAPAARFAESNTGIWGIAEESIEPGAIGAVLFSGIAILNLRVEKSVKFISPDGGGGYMNAGSGAAVLANNGSKIAALLNGNGNNYNNSAPYALNFDPARRLVTVNSGYINRNGVFGAAQAGELEPRNGTVCVHSELLPDGKGAWSEPKILYAAPGKNYYPVGKVTVGENGGVAIFSYPVTVAVIIDTAECPYSEAHYA